MIWGFAGISGSFLVAVFSVNQLHAAVPVYRLTFSQRAPKNTRPHEVGGAHGSIALVPHRNSRATFPGLLPPAITPAVGRPARCTGTVPGDTGSVGDVVAHQQQASSRIWRALHPLPAFYRPRSRSAAPVTSRCTRYVAMHPIRRGVMLTDRVHRRPQQAQPRTIPPHRPQPSASDAATRPRHAHPGSEREALHHLGSITPVSEHYTTSDLV